MNEVPLSKVFHLIEPGPVVLVTTAIMAQESHDEPIAPKPHKEGINGTP